MPSKVPRVGGDEGCALAGFGEVREDGHAVGAWLAVGEEPLQLDCRRADQLQHLVERRRADHRRHRSQPDARGPGPEEEPGGFAAHRQISGDHLAGQGRSDGQQGVADLGHAGAERRCGEVVRAGGDSGVLRQAEAVVLQFADRFPDGREQVLPVRQSAGRQRFGVALAGPRIEEGRRRIGHIGGSYAGEPLHHHVLAVRRRRRSGEGLGLFSKYRSQQRPRGSREHPVARPPEDLLGHSALGPLAKDRAAPSIQPGDRRAHGPTGIVDQPQTITLPGDRDHGLVGVVLEAAGAWTDQAGRPGGLGHLLPVVVEGDGLGDCRSDVDTDVHGPSPTEGLLRHVRPGRAARGPGPRGSSRRRRPRRSRSAARSGAARCAGACRGRPPAPSYGQTGASPA